MTTARETCMCECEECLALRAAEDDPSSGDTVAAFEHDESTYEIDHLGIGSSKTSVSSRYRRPARQTSLL